MAKNAEVKNVGGRTIANWKDRLRQDYPEAFKTDPHATSQAGRIKAMADAVNKWAQEGGYSFNCDSATVVKWLEQEEAKGTKPTRTRPEPTSADRSQDEEGEALATLRTLVKLLGKDAVKKLIDGL
jgi:hypothetical protein